jgi:hypothetical protein
VFVVTLYSQLLKLREHSDEQKERTETAECQISTISQEYRKLVESRDTEIRHLKTENEKLREEGKGHLESPLKDLAQLQLDDQRGDFESVDIGGGGGREWLDEYHEDFSDVISSQAEINRLRSELSRVRMGVKSVAENRVCVFVGAWWREQTKVK